MARTRKTRPDWTTEPLVMCADGPHAHAWFTESDWEIRVRASRRTFEATGVRLPALDYVPAGKVPHPDYPDVMGTVLRHRPAAARSAGAA